MTRAIFRSPLIRFGLTGLLNTFVGLGTIFALKWWLNWADTPANFLGYALGVTVSYLVNSRWTFQYRDALHAKVLPYALVLCLAYVVNLACVHLLIDVFRVDSYLAQASGVVPYSLLTFVLLRRFVFGASRAPSSPTP